MPCKAAECLQTYHIANVIMLVCEDCGVSLLEFTTTGSYQVIKLNTNKLAIDALMVWWK